MTTRPTPKESIITVMMVIIFTLMIGYVTGLMTIDRARLAKVQSIFIGLFNSYPTGVQARAPHTDIDYETAQQTIEQNRQKLADAYQSAANKSEKKAVLSQARGQFIDATTTLLPYWYGTPWDYNGTSSTPQQGSLACGYYVSTVLQDSGLQVQRRKLAQQASENIIKSLTSEPHIKRFSNVPLDDFVATINDWGEGLYIVGLDTHVGYIWHDGTDIHFIHTALRGALLEPAHTSATLARSHYRVLGKISADDDLLIRWLEQKSIKTQT